MKKKTIFTALAIGSLLVGVGCKNAEKKRGSKSDTPSTETATTPPAAQGKPAAQASPHGGMPAPGTPGHGGAASNPHGGAGASGMAMQPPSVKAEPTAADGTKVIGPLSVKVPKAWKETPPTGMMRLAQWSIGDKNPGELVAYNFGGTGGGVDANINRWIGQFSQEDGSPSAKKAVRKDQVVNGLKVSTLSLSGRYVAAVRPGQAAKHDSPDYKMLAAIVTVGDTAFFFKMIGPKATLDATEKDWNEFIKSIKQKK